MPEPASPQPAFSKAKFSSVVEKNEEIFWETPGF